MRRRPPGSTRTDTLFPYTALVRSLRGRASAVLVAPPGAGKTTAVAPALPGEPWCEGQILLLSPRRLAARAAAERMAALAGEPVGRTIGYATRLDRKQSADTRILVLTEGTFRPEERSVGKACVSTCRSLWSPDQ